MTILPSSTSTLSHWNPLCCHILFYKIKNKMPVWQITDYIFTAAANLLLGGYTSALTISISIIRNRLMTKENDQDYFVHPHYSSNHRRILISINLGLLAICQFISSVSYSLSIAITRNLQQLRWVIIENMLLWLIYDLIIKAYPAAIIDITITLTTLIAIIRNRKTFSN